MKDMGSLRLVSSSEKPLITRKRCFSCSGNGGFHQWGDDQNPLRVDFATCSDCDGKGYVSIKNNIQK